MSGFGLVERYGPAIVATYDPEIVKYTMIDIGTIRISGMEAIDTLAVAKKLKGAGMPDAQAEAFAEAQADVFRSMLDSTLATKDDLAELRQATKADMANLATKKDLTKLATKEELARLATKEELAELRGDMQQMEAGLRGEIAHIKTDVLRLMLGQTIALIGVIFAAAAFF